MLELTEAAAIMKCSIATLEDHLRSGHITGTKFGVSWVIPREAFFARINEIAAEEALARRAPAPVVPFIPREPETNSRSGRRNRLASV